MLRNRKENGRRDKCQQRGGSRYCFSYPHPHTEKKGNDEDVLKKIVATGNVKITTDQYVANTEELEYDAASMEITLTGEDSKVVYGKDSIAGSKIILYQKDGRVKVLGSKKKRIKAEFFSKGNQSDAFKVGKPKN